MIQLSAKYTTGIGLIAYTLLQTKVNKLSLNYTYLLCPAQNKNDKAHCAR